VALSTIPPVTALAWTSFTTGRSPGEHGIFGFRTVDPSTYRMSPVPGGAKKVPTLMQGLDRLGYRTCQVTVPWTYPADHLDNGVIVPGWDAPDESLDGIHPPEMAEELRSIVDRVPRESPQLSDVQTYLSEQRANIELRERISSFLIEQTDPHVFMTVFSESDQATHHLWTKPGIPESLIESYEQIDASMTRMMDQFVTDDDLVLVVSDHGGLLQHTHVHVAHLLQSAGWLSLTNGSGSTSTRAKRSLKRRVWYRMPPLLRNAVARRLSRDFKRKVAKSLRATNIDWSKTAAFPVGNEHAGLGICVNVNPPYDKGPVTPDSYDKIRDSIASYLADVKDPSTGDRIFTRVARKEEVYEGPEVSNAPDLLLVPEDGYGTSSGTDLSAPLSRVAVGGHRREGIYALNRSVGLASTERIEDLLPKVLNAEGLPVEAIKNSEAEAEGGYSDEEARAVEDRLRSLGYIE
jgi:predicted AlkP superfamily phosphohydrolase/phosphomutase